MDMPTDETISGTLKQFNYSPEGIYEGFLLKSKKQIVQVNFPPEVAPRIAAEISEGEKVKAVVEAHVDGLPSDHPVYSLLSLSTKRGVSIGASNDDNLQGKVARINYAKHGEPNGAVLESGDFVHLKPHGARLVKLAVGEMLEVKGEAKPMAGGGPHRVIEAVYANGIDLTEHAKAKKVVAKPATKKALKKAAKETA
jgi:predicted DNA-binding antitoxin AbrB/MazE fold protein